MIDLRNNKELLKYLTEKLIIKSSENVQIRILSGGISCDVVRIDFPEGSMVIKKALPKLRVSEEWRANIQRIVNEKDCLLYYHKLVPECTPEEYFYDSENFQYGMEAAPETAVMWKTQLMNGQLDLEAGRQAAKALATVHNDAAQNQEIRNRFQDKTYFMDLRIAPYLQTTAQRHPQLKKELMKECRRLLASQQTLIHGDYSPKNILVNNSRIYILDYEVACMGDASFDLAFLMSHLYLKAAKFASNSQKYLHYAIYVAETYLSQVLFTGREQLETDSVRLMGMLMLARIDGKSPIEYISSKKEKDKVRQIAYHIIQEHTSTFQEAAEILLFKENRNADKMEG